MDLSEFEKHLDLFSRLQHPSAAGINPEITFDDGHLSDYEVALPLLVERNLKAHFFVTVGWIGNKNGYMEWSQLRALHQAGQTVGAHGWNHELLTHCDKQGLVRELLEARLKLEDELGCRVTTMSLPGGRSNRRVLDACWESGYSQVYSSLPRVESDPAAQVIGRLNIRREMALTWIEGLFDPRSKTISSLERQARLKAAARAVVGDKIYAQLWSALNRQESESQP